MSLKLPSIRPDGLQLDEPAEFQRKFWIAQRFGWGVFLVLVIAAFVGLAGAGGPFSRATHTMMEGSIDLPRVARRMTPETIQIRFAAVDTPGRRVFLSEDFNDGFEITSIQPEPERTKAVEGGQEFLFDSSGAVSTTVRINIRPQAPGIIAFQVAVNGGNPRSLSVLSLP